MASDVIPALSVAGFEATSTGLIVHGEPGYEAWEAYGQGLQRVHKAIHWVIGDWLNYGEAVYGESYAQAVVVSGFAVETLRNDKWVASRVEMSRRRGALSFGHHQVVAPLDADLQEKCLAKAARERLSVRELRALLRGESPEVRWWRQVVSVGCRLEVLAASAPEQSLADWLMGIAQQLRVDKRGKE